MSRFVINLPGNKKGNVWCLKIINMHHVDHVDFGPKSAKITSSSDPTYTLKAFKYEITVPDEESSSLYILYKFVNGEWSADFMARKPIADNLLVAIRDVIIEKEKELNDL